MKRIFTIYCLLTVPLISCRRDSNFASDDQPILNLSKPTERTSSVPDGKKVDDDFYCRMANSLLSSDERNTFDKPIYPANLISFRDWLDSKEGLHWRIADLIARKELTLSHNDVSQKGYSPEKLIKLYKEYLELTTKDNSNSEIYDRLAIDILSAERTMKVTTYYSNERKLALITDWNSLRLFDISNRKPKLQWARHIIFDKELITMNDATGLISGLTLVACLEKSFGIPWPKGHHYQRPDIWRNDPELFLFKSLASFIAVLLFNERIIVYSIAKSGGKLCAVRKLITDFQLRSSHYDPSEISNKNIRKEVQSIIKEYNHNEVVSIVKSNEGAFLIMHRHNILSIYKLNHRNDIFIKCIGIFYVK